MTQSNQPESDKPQPCLCGGAYGANPRTDIYCPVCDGGAPLEQPESDATYEAIYVIVREYPLDGVDIRDLSRKLAAECQAAQTNAVAWTVGVVDDCHFQASNMRLDSTFKGIKNTIRDRYKAEVGIDPAPSYPVKAALRNASRKDAE